MRATAPLPLLLLTLTMGCGHSIGDSCSTNVQCSPNGDRICDTAQVDGYCTIEGCDLTSCPDEATCVRFFSAGFLSTACNPITEGVVSGAVATRDCTSSELCLTSGFCALRSSERRFCMKRCERDDDCRGGYECHSTGTRGAEALPDPAQPGTVVRHRFCAPKL
jgi:hypothetical protein